MVRPLNEWTATEIVSAVSSGRTTAEAIMRACLDRIAEREPEVRAWAYLDPDLAISAARAFDRSGRDGPLAGVPFAVKDIIDTVDMPTEWGTPIHRGRMAGRDAACVALGRKAGGVLLGKAVTTEFANRFPGPTRNPHDPTRTPGGSSSGSAAAVADFMVPLALGTQTTGSTIRPSAFCGIVGYRPTYGEHRLHGVMEASGSLDTLGILARSIDDVALYRDVLLGIPFEPVADLPPPRIGFCRTHVWEHVEPTSQALAERVVDTLAAAGAEVSDVQLPREFERLTEAHTSISSFEFARTFTWEMENRWGDISEVLRGNRISDGLSCTLARYLEMQSLAERCRLEMDSTFSDYDVMMTPSAIGEAPTGWNPNPGAILYKMWTTLHVPALAVPVAMGPNDMPIGVQFFARRHRDRALFAHVRWAQRTLS